jgi:hypothetical protein
MKFATLLCFAIVGILGQFDLLRGTAVITPIRILQPAHCQRYLDPVSRETWCSPNPFDDYFVREQ